MPPLTNENEFRVTRSRTNAAENRLLAAADPKLSLDARNALRDAGGALGGATHPFKAPVVTGNASQGVTAAGAPAVRPHLRDVSLQFGIAQPWTHQPTKCALAVGVESSRAHKLDIPASAGAAASAGYLVDDLDKIHEGSENMENIDNALLLAHTHYPAISANSHIAQNVAEGAPEVARDPSKPASQPFPLTADRAPLAPISHRLPQKRQATESSNNLVEQLYTGGNFSPDACSSKYKKSRKTEYEWQDFDEEDFDDPLMVSEYVNEIFPYLYLLEKKMLPDLAYLLKQTQLKPRMRSILVDWLVEMHQRFRLLPETLFLAINIMDRFMSVEVVQIDKLQLLATSSLFIAAKYEEVFSPSVKNYAYFTDGSYTEDEILEAEKYILTVLNFDMNFPNPMNFLRRISKADDYDLQLRTLAKYLLEVTIVDHKFIGVLPSLCSAAAMYIARRILRKDPVWNGNLIHFSGGYHVEDMKECVQLLFNYLLAPIEHDEFFKKYSSRKFMKALFWPEIRACPPRMPCVPVSAS